MMTLFWTSPVLQRDVGLAGRIAGRLGYFVVALCLALLAAPPDVRAQTADQPGTNFVLSTAGTGGAFHQGGVSLSALIKIKLLPDMQIDLATSNSTGSLENIARLQEGTTDFAIVQGLLARDARLGTGLAADIGPQRNLRAITMLWPNVEHFIVRRDAAPTGTISDFLNVRGKRVSLGRERSAIESNRILLANLGLDIDRDVIQVPLAFRSSANAFRQGDIDALSLPASTPVAAFTDLIGELGPDAKVLNWSDDQLRQADSNLGLWSPLTIPAETYPGQTEPIQTIAQPNFLAVRADVDEDAVYEITKAIFENLPFLRRLHEPFRYLTLERAVDGLPVPLHPGTVRYFREARLDLSNAVIADNDYDIFGNDLTTPVEIRQRLGRGAVTLVTAEDGTSDRMTNELLDLLAPREDVRILPLKGKGTAHNLADLLYLSGVDIGVLQADAMDYARRQNLYPDLVDNIRYVTKWSDSEVHLLVRDDILKPGDLLEQPVNFGPRGSGSEVTASLLFNRLRIPVRQTSFAHATALEKLKAGEIAGMIHVAAKPIPLLQTIQVRDGLRFLSLPPPNNSGLYRPADLTVADYPTLIFGQQTIKTLAVPQVLATYDWPTDNDRYEPIARFVDIFLSGLNELQADSRHAKWLEVDPAVDLDGWQRHPTAEAFLAQRRTAAQSNGQGGPLTNTDGEAEKAAPRLGAGNQVSDDGPPARLPAAPGKPSRHRPIF